MERPIRPEEGAILRSLPPEDDGYGYYGHYGAPKFGKEVGVREGQAIQCEGGPYYFHTQLRPHGIISLDEGRMILDGRARLAKSGDQWILTNLSKESMALYSEARGWATLPAGRKAPVKHGQRVLVGRHVSEFYDSAEPADSTENKRKTAI